MVRGYLPTHWRNMILPDGAVELMFNLGDPQKPLRAGPSGKAYDFSTELDFRRADHTDRD